VSNYSRLRCPRSPRPKQEKVAKATDRRFSTLYKRLEPTAPPLVSVGSIAIPAAAPAPEPSVSLGEGRKGRFAEAAAALASASTHARRSAKQAFEVPSRELSPQPSISSNDKAAAAAGAAKVKKVLGLAAAASAFNAVASDAAEARAAEEAAAAAAAEAEKAVKSPVEATIWEPRVEVMNNILRIF